MCVKYVFIVLLSLVINVLEIDFFQNFFCEENMQKRYEEFKEEARDVLEGVLIDTVVYISAVFTQSLIYGILASKDKKYHDAFEQAKEESQYENVGYTALASLFSRIGYKLYNKW